MIPQHDDAHTRTRTVGCWVVSLERIVVCYRLRKYIIRSVDFSVLSDDPY